MPQEGFMAAPVYRHEQMDISVIRVLSGRTPD
jgi:hypothetical protein